MIYFKVSTLERVVLGSCTDQETVTDTALRAISPWGSRGPAEPDLATGDTDRRRCQNRKATLDLRAGEAVEDPEEVLPQVLLPRGGT